LGVFFAALTILLRIAYGFSLLLGLANIVGGITRTMLLKGSTLLLVATAPSRRRTPGDKPS
jgi:hypothetical protein